MPAKRAGFQARMDRPEFQPDMSAARKAHLPSGAGLCMCWMGCLLALSLHAQIPGGESSPLAASIAPQSVVRWTGSLPDAANETVDVLFSIYQDQAGGLALWTETQSVKIGPDGQYSVLLGATSVEGLPWTLFQAGEARWIEARWINESAGNTSAKATGSPHQARRLLAAVPYALKSVDSDTLGGRAATDYLTREDLQPAIAAAERESSQANPKATAVTGAGTAGYIPVWTGKSALGNSVVFNSGTKVGIDTAAPAANLDVDGTTHLRGGVTLVPAAATATAGASSPVLEWSASAYSKTAKAAVTQNFVWQATVTGNNTASPSANLELSTSSGAAAPKLTGLSIGHTGLLTFAPGQTFPGTGKGTITGITTSAPLTGSGTSGTVAVGLDTTQLETTLNSVYAQLAKANNFTDSLTAHQTAGAADAAISGIGTNGSTGTIGSSDTGFGVGGTATNASVTGAAYNVFSGVWGDTGASSTAVAPAWAIGVLGTADDSQAGVFLNNSTGWPTVYAENYGTGGTTGLFKTLMAVSNEGTCGVGGGSLSCTGQIKSLVPAGNGARKVETYAMQSPENWIEDFGSGNLESGVAVVHIDPAFAETVTGDANYHVFLTPNGDSKGLYVTGKTADRFEVRESGGGTSSLSFDYRIVAKRRGYEAQRLTDVTERFNAESRAAVVARRSGVKKAAVPARQATSR